ncbi:hypothetical protein M758_UG233200 [Ceratodon purpureus]|nr:hypothetical protein M758_UG233200 [Ceratodon purpureus]
MGWRARVDMKLTNNALEISDMHMKLTNNALEISDMHRKLDLILQMGLGSMANAKEVASKRDLPGVGLVEGPTSLHTPHASGTTINVPDATIPYNSSGMDRMPCATATTTHSNKHPVAGPDERVPSCKRSGVENWSGVDAAHARLSMPTELPHSQQRKPQWRPRKLTGSNLRWCPGRCNAPRG